MREKKFANILDDYPEEVVEEIKEETQEKLSMTRELKFKELQDKIDEEDIVSSVTEEVKLEETDTPEETITLESSKKELKQKAKEEKKECKALQEDLYLTSSFKPLRKRFKLNKLFKFIFTLLLIIGILGAFGYFVVWPLYNKYMDSKPKAIFEHAIDYIADTAYNTIDSNWSYTDDFSSLEFGLMIESDEDVDYANTYYGFNFGFNDTQAEEYIYIKNPETNEEYGISLLVDNDMMYYKTTLSDIFYGSENDSEINFGLYDEDGEQISISKEEIKYFIDTERNTIKKLLLDKYIKAEADEIEIDGKTIDVTKNSYTLTGEDFEVISDKYKDILLKDKKYLEIFAKIAGISVEEVKEEYFENVDTEVDEDYTLSFNIYTIKGNKVVGFDIEENGFRILYLYYNEDEFDFHLNLTTDEDCLEGRDCVMSNMMVLDLKGTYKDDYTEVVVEYNEDEVATLDIREFSFEKIDLDYDIDYMDFELEGTLKIDLDTDKHEYKAEVLVDIDGTEMNIVFDLKLKDEFKLEEINPEKVEEYTEKKFNDEVESFYYALDEVGLVDEFDLWFETFMGSFDDGTLGDVEIIA